MLRPDPRPFLPALTMPVTVVTGEADGLAPPDAARRLPAAVAAEINALCRQLEPA
jgi:pimeloyl-ACP methyl ester carboxylesterase